jgi:putative effector of murein hydrolase
MFTALSMIIGALSVYATKSGFEWAKPIETIFFMTFTIATYVWGARLPNGFVRLVHPLVTSSLMNIALIRALARITNRHHLDILRGYKAGTFAIQSVGAGDILLYLCGTGVISFAVSMYSRRAILISNLPVLVTAMLVSTVGSLFSTAAFVHLLSLGEGSPPLVRLSILSRNVTTALSMAITALLGGDISMAAAIVCLTGVLGGTYGKPLMNALGITDPITRGLGIGSSSQGLGVAAIADEPDAFPFAAISMVLTALAATALVSIPAFKDALVHVAVGDKL